MDDYAPDRELVDFVLARFGELDPDDRDLKTLLMQRDYISRSQSQPDLVWRNLLRQPVHCVELRHRLPVGVDEVLTRL